MIEASGTTFAHQNQVSNSETNTMQSQQNQHGFIAISSVLTVAAIVLTLGVSVALITINHLQSSFAYYQSKQAQTLAEGCAELALLELNETGTISNTITLPEGTCSVTIDSQVGKITTFTVSITQNSYTKSIEVEADRTSIVEVTSWQYLP